MNGSVAHLKHESWQYPDPDMDMVAMFLRVQDLTAQLETLTRRMDSLESSISGEM